MIPMHRALQEWSAAWNEITLKAAFLQPTDLAAELDVLQAMSGIAGSENMLQSRSPCVCKTLRTGYSTDESFTKEVQHHRELSSPQNQASHHERVVKLRSVARRWSWDTCQGSGRRALFTCAWRLTSS